MELAAAATSMLEPLAVLRAVRDEAGEIIDFVSVFVNEAGIDALLLPIATLLNKRLLEALPEHRDRLFENYRHVTETGEPFIGREIGYDDRRSSGKIVRRTYNIRASKVGDGVAVSWNDITDHLEARQRLFAENRELQLHQQVFESMFAQAEEAAANAIQRLAYRSTHDPLTGLPNRSKILSTLNRSMHNTRDDSIAVLFIDVDHFKRVNNGMSHSTGDSVLIEVGRRIRSCVRSDDLVGRLGGDEFAVVAPGIQTTEEAMELAERVRLEISDQPFDSSGSRIHVSVSVGVSGSSADTSPQEVLSRADTALHLAKSRGRNCCALADSRMIETARARLQLIDQLHDGIAMEEFHPWFQPIVDLESGEVIGHEVLARWTQPDRVLAAGSFIDAAEDSGLINPIGRKIIGDAIEVYAIQGRDGFLSLNASPVQLRAPGFAESILNQLAAAGIGADRITLEITEQSLLVNEGTIINNLREFHENNVGLYVDDFGTGFSSITTLRDYPIAGIKLDKSFSQLLSKDLNGSIADLISGLSELASHLRLDRIAEGIEDPKCAERLKELGWVRGQGFLYGHAEPFTPASGLPTASIPHPRPRAVPDPAPSTVALSSTHHRRANDRSA